jgi:hypothetical protein
VAKVQDSRQAQGQAQWSGTGSGQDRQGSKTRRTRNWKKAGAATQTTGRLEQTRQTGNRQTENTGINTQGIMGKMGDTWRGVETITKTGETDQGVTVRLFLG